MYFVHPQIKFNIKNLGNLLSCFFKKTNLESLKKVEEMFPAKKVYFTDMGRSAFRLIVEELQLQNSQILVPAYICDIFYSIFKQYNIFPIFLDVDKQTFNISLEEIEKKITSQTKSILICHTYGLPFNIQKIKENYQLLIIEDCAHSFGAKRDGKFTGNFGDAAFFSLYKIFPTLRGGMVVLPSGISKKLAKTRFSPRDFITLLNCCSFFSFLFKKYAGKVAPKYIKKEKLEQVGALNRVSLNILSWQLENFEKNLKKRRELALIFQQELKKMGFETQNSENNIFTFLSALVPENINRDEFVIALRKKGVFPTRIWHTPIILNPEVQKEYNIDISKFPNTIDVSQRIINFPLQNFYSQKDIKKMLKKIKETSVA